MVSIQIRDYVTQLWTEFYTRYRTREITKKGYWCIPTNTGESVCINVEGEEKSSAYLESNERSVLTDLISEVTKEDVFWDVGAHKGLYSVLVGKKIGDGRIVSFEPDKNLVSTFNKVCEMNNLNPSIYEIALSNKEGEIELLSTGPTSGRGVINEGKLDKYSEFESDSAQVVKQMTADNLVSERNLDPPTIVKIDVEGAEGLVLQGMEDILSNNTCRIAYVEIHKPSDIGQSVEDFGFSVDEIIELMAKFGYRYEILEEESGNVRVKFLKDNQNK